MNEKSRDVEKKLAGKTPIYVTIGGLNWQGKPIVWQVSNDEKELIAVAVGTRYKWPHKPTFAFLSKFVDEKGTSLEVNEGRGKNKVHMLFTRIPWREIQNKTNFSNLPPFHSFHSGSYILSNYDDMKTRYPVKFLPIKRNDDRRNKEGFDLNPVPPTNSSEFFSPVSNKVTQKQFPAPASADLTQAVVSDRVVYPQFEAVIWTRTAEYVESPPLSDNIYAETASKINIVILDAGKPEDKGLDPNEVAGVITGLCEVRDPSLKIKIPIKIMEAYFKVEEKSTRNVPPVFAGPPPVITPPGKKAPTFSPEEAMKINSNYQDGVEKRTVLNSKGGEIPLRAVFLAWEYNFKKMFKRDMNPVEILKVKKAICRVLSTIPENKVPVPIHFFNNLLKKEGEATPSLLPALEVSGPGLAAAPVPAPVKGVTVRVPPLGLSAAPVPAPIKGVTVRVPPLGLSAAPVPAPIKGVTVRIPTLGLSAPVPAPVKGATISHSVPLPSGLPGPLPAAAAALPARTPVKGREVPPAALPPAVATSKLPDYFNDANSEHYSEVIYDNLDIILRAYFLSDLSAEEENAIISKTKDAKECYRAHVAKLNVAELAQYVTFLEEIDDSDLTGQLARISLRVFNQNLQKKCAIASVGMPLTGKEREEMRTLLKTLTEEIEFFLTNKKGEKVEIIHLHLLGAEHHTGYILDQLNGRFTKEEIIEFLEDQFSREKSGIIYACAKALYLFDRFRAGKVDQNMARVQSNTDDQTKVMTDFFKNILREEKTHGKTIHFNKTLEEALSKIAPSPQDKIAALEQNASETQRYVHALSRKTEEQKEEIEKLSSELRETNQLLRQLLTTFGAGQPFNQSNSTPMTIVPSSADKASEDLIENALNLLYEDVSNPTSEASQLARIEQEDINKAIEASTEYASTYTEPYTEMDMGEVELHQFPTMDERKPEDSTSGKRKSDSADQPTKRSKWSPTKFQGGPLSKNLDYGNEDGENSGYDFPM